MKKYMCWVWTDEPIQGWVLSPQNTVLSEKSFEEIKAYFEKMYPNRLLRIEIKEMNPKQLSLF